MTVLPVAYNVKGLPGVYLCFRVAKTDDGRYLLSLIPNTAAQHPMDVLAMFADDPALTVAMCEEAYP